MKIVSIHQFAFAVSANNGVTNGILYAQKLLRSLDFESEIFALEVPPVLRPLIHTVSRVSDLAASLDAEHSLLILHHCMGYDEASDLLELPMRKLMIYHNITPPEWLPKDSEIARYAALGRQQLKAWPNHFIGAIGDSPFNSAELREHNYPHVRTIPMLIDPDRWQVLRGQVDLQKWSHLSDAYNLLFVGRFCENKNQMGLLELLPEIKKRTSLPVRLIMVGEVTSPSYRANIQIRAAELGLQDVVLFPGKLSDPDLCALYQSADLFVCLSEHEGFGMPLIEAMHFNLPVLAKNSSNIANTLGDGGVLMSASATSSDIAAAIVTLMKEPALKRQILQAQRQHLQQFSFGECQRQLAEYLAELGIEVPKQAQKAKQLETPLTWQIEGPFDSSYSLAIVNRELARALDSGMSSESPVQIALRSHEGHGDFAPSEQFLVQDAKSRQLFERHQTLKDVAELPSVALRFCYPPHVDAMPAIARVVHSYGWEETGFPQAYVDGFNRRLDLITVLSHSVGKTLRDNGVRIPIVVTGAGMDHLDAHQAETLPAELQSTFKAFCFLHVSSGFPRKGVDVLLRAYANAFTAQDEVSLIIKTFPNPHQHIRADIDQLRTEYASFPHVVVIDEDWAQPAMVGLYRASHAYVAPSRGEGLGLPLAEAMRFDLPVITTAWGGQSDFCDDSTAWCCDYDFAKAQTHLGLTHSLWAEPKVAHLSELMKQVWRGSESEKKQRTETARIKVQKQLTWQATAKRVRQAVQALRQETALRKEPKIAWISTWNARCGIANYSHAFTKAIPRSRLRVLANHIPERTGIDQDYVLRCWNAHHDEDFAYALESIIEEQIGAVVIQYNFGFCSPHNLAQFLQQLKARQIQAHVFFHSTAEVQAGPHWMSLGDIRTSLAQAERLYVHGVEDVNRLKQWGLVDNVVYFPHGIAPRLSVKPAKDPGLMGRTVIASYGFLLPHKGIPELIDAFALLSQERDDLHLLLVNSLYPISQSAELAQGCREAIARHCLTQRVTMLNDYLSEVQCLSYLSQADVVVFPYQATQESSSAAVRVGLASGCPVMVTPLSIFDDVAEAVHYLPGCRPQELAAGLAHFLSQGAPSEAKNTDIETWFAERQWPALAQRLINLIDGLANPLECDVRNC